MALILVTKAAASTLLTAAEVRPHLRLPAAVAENALDEAEDDYIEALIEAAIEATEVKTQRALTANEYLLTRDSFAAGRVIKLEKAPVHEDGISIKYDDENGDEQTLSASLYAVDTYSTPARIVLNENESWPDTLSAPGAVRISYTAGYVKASTADTDERLKLPSALKHALLFLIANWFSARESVVVGQSGLIEVPVTYDFLVKPYRVYSGA